MYSNHYNKPSPRNNYDFEFFSTSSLLGASGGESWDEIGVAKPNLPPGHIAGSLSIALLLSALLFISSPVSAAPPDFDRDIMPILTRHGCNTGACHGAAVGRGEFLLSLYGTRPVDDYHQIVQSFGGRRIDFSDSQQSLIIAKPTGYLDHGGDMRFDADSTAADLITQWIDAVAQPGSGVRPTELNILPGREVDLKLNQSTELSISANYTDGEQRTVTAWTHLTIDEPEAISLNNTQNTITLTAHRSGIFLLTARYWNQVAVIRVWVTDPTKPAVSESASGHQIGEIDRIVNKTLLRADLPIANIADGPTFLRRLSLDLRGKLPSIEEWNEFAATPDCQLWRSTWVQRFVSSQEFSSHWAQLLGDFVQLGSPQSAQQRGEIREWLASQVSQHVPFNQIAESILTATGTIESNPASSYHFAANDPRLRAELFSRTWMGVRLECAACHDHPLDHWTQDDYHGLAAMFAGIKASENGIFVDPQAVVYDPRTAEPARRKLLGTDIMVPEKADSANDLEADPNLVCDWLLEDSNPYFRRNLANRIWAGLFGTGLIDPVTDLRDTNPASHPELLDYLSGRLQENSYSIQDLISEICASQTYGRISDASASPMSSRFNQTMAVRPMSPRVYKQAIRQVLFSSDLPASELKESSFPRSPKQPESACTRELNCEETPIAAALRSINGVTINGDVLSRNNDIRDFVDSKKDPKEILQILYQRATFRDLPEEIWLTLIPRFEQCKTAVDPNEAQLELLQDLAWSLLTSDQFQKIH